MTKSRKRMLLSSVAMLLVALVALGSATYAWFTINKTVKADTMQVTAGVAAGLEITNNNGQAWARTVHYTGNYDLTPVSVPSITVGSALTTSAFYPKDVEQDNIAVADKTKAWQTLTISSERPTLDTTDRDESGSATAVEAAGDNGYFAEYRMGIRSSDGTTDLGSVNAAITCTGDAKNGEKFAKAVLIKEGTTPTVVGYYNDASYTPIGSVSGDSFTNGTAIAANAASYAVQSATTTAQYYRLLVWYEGNDAQCINDNSGTTANFTVSFTLAS